MFFAGIDGSNNYLQEIHQNIFQAHNVTSLKLINIGLKVIPSAITSLMSLTLLDLSENFLSHPDPKAEILHSFSFLKYVVFEKNRLSDFPLEASSPLTTRLVHLNIGWNTISELQDFSAMQCEYLNVSKIVHPWSYFKAASYTLQPLCWYLTELVLCDCLLSRIPTNLLNITGLTILNMSNNSLLGLNTIEKLSKLLSLDVQNNSLLSLPLQMAFMNHLTTIRLDGNSTLIDPPANIVELGAAAIKKHLLRHTKGYDDPLSLPVS
jgi:Leucine-rich repeat (LRR) protein